jgi:hypothetical protein
LGYTVILRLIFEFRLLFRRILSIIFKFLGRAETCQKQEQTPFVRVLSKEIPVLRIFRLKNFKKISFGEGQVQDLIQALSGHGSKIPPLFHGDT